MGSLSKLVKSAPTSNFPIKLLIYGEPGVGKTSYALSTNWPLLIDFDNGSHRALFNGEVYIPNSYNELTTVLSCKEDFEPYDTIVIDTIGAFQDFLTNSIRETGGAKLFNQQTGMLTQMGWGILKTKFKNVFDSLKQTRKNIVLIGHQTQKMEDNALGQGKTIIPAVSGSAISIIMQECDFVGLARFINGKRMLCFSANDNWYSKDCASLGDVVFDNTDSKYMPLQLLFEKMRYGYGKMSEQAAKNSAILKEWVIKIQSAETHAALEALAEEIKLAAQTIPKGVLNSLREVHTQRKKEIQNA